MPTLDDLTDEVLSHQFSAAQYDQFVRDRINEAQKKLLAEIDFRVAFASTSLAVLTGYTDYVLPSNFQRVYTAVLLNDDESNASLRQVKALEMDRLDRDTTGRPSQYSVTAQGGDAVVRIWPVPDADYTVRVRYYGLPSDMTAGTDEPLIPDEWQSLLTYYALFKCYERENDYNSAQYHKARWEEEKEKYKGQAQYDGDDYSQARQVGDDRDDPLAPQVPYGYR